MRLVRPLALAALVPLAPPAAGWAPPPEGAVRVARFAFAPDTVRVAAGARVTWTNADEAPHTVTAGEPGAPSGAFDRALAGVGASASVTLGTPGTYPYHCDRHRFMRGVVLVTTRNTGDHR